MVYSDYRVDDDKWHFAAVRVTSIGGPNARAEMFVDSDVRQSTDFFPFLETDGNASFRIGAEGAVLTQGIDL